MDEDTLLRRVDERGLRIDSVEAARMQRTVRAGVFDEPLEPTMIGRYEVIRRLGAGGMGVVYVARDAELHREVAVKLVLGPASSGVREQERLLEEARALARIAHPNVVAIYDVGVHSGRVFIAMELIRGETLRVHCAERCATWRECLAAYLQAGRGLAATHAAGLVHRDFKPDNALVGPDGRVQILDFGLARPESAEEATTTSESPEQATSTTPPSTVAGTFRYMAPEHRRGRPADARSDQFSFCVALWEALYREHPFTRAAREHDTPTSVPTRLRRLLQRGLSSDPAQRFSSMDELLAALSDDPRRRRRRRIAIVLGIAAIPAAWGARAWSDARDREACAHEGQTIAEIWNDGARRAVQAAILGPQLSYGAATWERVEPRLDAHAADWAAMRTSTCLTALEGRRQADLAARSRECLLEHRDELAATIDELGRANEDTIRNAVQAVAELPSLAPCDDVAALAKRSPPPDDSARREEVAELRRELARSRALWAAGQSEAARALADVVLTRAEALDWPALRLDALMHVGLCSERNDDEAAAVALYEEAFALAVRLGDDEVAMDVLARLTFGHGELGRPEQAELWAQVADAFVARADPDEGLPTASLLNSRAAVWHRQGNFSAALEYWRRALAIRERILGPDDARTLQVLANIGVVQVDLGDMTAAATTMQRVLEGRTLLLGPEHPDVAKALTNLAGLRGAQGHLVEGRALLERALEIEERAPGKDHARLVRTLHNLGLIEERLGDNVKALATLERALELVEHADDVDPLRVGHALLAVAGVRSKLHDVSGAIAAAERAESIIETAVGSDHPEFALALDELAFAHELAGEYEVAQTERRRIVEIREATLGPWHPDTGSAWLERGRSELLAANPEAALADVRRGLAITSRMYGPRHPNVAFALTDIGLAHRLRGELDLALRWMLDANALAPLAFGPTHERVAESFVHVGDVLVARGEHAAALSELQRAWAMLEALPESERGEADRFLTSIAEAELGLGRVDEAETHARAAVEHARARGRLPYVLAEAEIVLADVLRSEHKGDAARALAKRACAVAHPTVAFRFARCAAWGRARDQSASKIARSQPPSPLRSLLPQR